MTIKIPRSLRGFAYDGLLPVDLNTFDIDLLLPSVFFKVISGGQTWGRRPNDPTRIREYVATLGDHSDVVGFGGADGLRVLERLVRTSLVQIGRRGTSRTVEQIEGVNEYTLLAFKPEFPVEHSRLRRVDNLIYGMMRSQLRSDEALRAFFKEVFGKGLTLKGGPEPSGWYDGETDLDTLTRLSISLIEGFASTGVRKAKERPVREACPALADLMARDIRRYLQAYNKRMPMEALAYHLKALMNLELLVYSLKLFAATVDLVERPREVPSAMRATQQYSPPEVYVDFTGSMTGLSREMAGTSVRRDLEFINRFIHANLTLRQLDLYVRRLRGDRRVGLILSDALSDAESGPAYLQSLLLLLEEPVVALRIDAAAQQDEDAIRRENSPLREDHDESVDEHEELDRVAKPAGSDFERVVLLLTEGQRTKIAQNMAAWYWSVGGLQKPHGILTGTLKNRQSWRYAPSNDLLATLVQLAAVDIPKWEKDDPAPQPIQLREFLEWLEFRFGILVDRPPEGFIGADYVAAARDNLRAMLRRLQQMGVFRDLSDDFTVQRLIPPYAVVSEEQVFV